MRAFTKVQKINNTIVITTEKKLNIINVPVDKPGMADLSQSDLEQLTDEEHDTLAQFLDGGYNIRSTIKTPKA